MNWKVELGPTAKSTVASELAALTTSGLIFTDVQSPNLSDATLEAHLAAAVTAAQTLLAGLTGAAPNCAVRISGHTAYESSAPLPYGTGSTMNIQIMERW